MLQHPAHDPLLHSGINLLRHNAILPDLVRRPAGGIKPASRGADSSRRSPPPRPTAGMHVQPNSLYAQFRTPGPPAGRRPSRRPARVTQTSVFVSEAPACNRLTILRPGHSIRSKSRETFPSMEQAWSCVGTRPVTPDRLTVPSAGWVMSSRKAFRQATTSISSGCSSSHCSWIPSHNAVIQPAASRDRRA